MKKLITLVFAIGTLSCVVAQVEIRDYTGAGGTQVGNDISGTVFSVNVDQPGTVFQHFAVTNVSGTDQYLGIKRLRIDVPGDWSDQLSWAPDPDENFEGGCYSPNQMNSNPWTSANVPATNHFPTILDQNIGNLSIEIDVQSNGTGLYRYYIMSQQGLAIDSVDLEINASTLGIFNSNETAKIEVYPSPANDNLIIKSTLEDNTALKITDLFGKVVYEDELSTIKKTDISDYKNGVYVVSVYNQGVLIQTRKVLVNH